MFSLSNVLIVGYGCVGKNLSEELKTLAPDVYDVSPELQSCCTKKDIIYDVAFICVDTPLGKDGLLDVSAVNDAVKQNKAKVYVIKSTVPVGFTSKLISDGVRAVFSPEYYGGTQHCNNFNFDFTILGGAIDDCLYVQQLLQLVYDGRHRFFIEEPEIAELAKFMENAWLATKVSFCVDFYEACKKIGVPYERLRKLFIADPRVNKSHTFVYSDSPYFSSHCLNKDVPHIANQFDMRLLKNVLKINFDRRSQSEL